MSTLAAIDPGKSGGIAWLPRGGTVACEKMPDTERDICELLRHIVCGSEGVCTVYLEDVPIGMPGKGAASSKLNANAGFIRGVLNALNAQIMMTRPAKWQETFAVGKRSGCKSDSEWKGKLKNRAQQIYPGIKVTLDKADALLLLEYGRRQP